VLTRNRFVPAFTIRQRLEGAGFRQVTRAECVGVDVYDRTHDRDPRYRVVVQVSVDAIRVVATFDRGPEFTELPIFTAAWVPRAGNQDQVLDRMIARAREAYSACNGHRSGGKVVNG
jgi:hypothetical protein